MFDLVADVEEYPKFLPLCQSLQVRRRSTLPTGEEVLVADMRVGYRAIRESFTSRVTLDRARMTILVEYIDGPFKALENRWTFRDVPERPGSSVIEFYIRYEFKSRMLGHADGLDVRRRFPPLRRSVRDEGRRGLFVSRGR